MSLATMSIFTEIAALLAIASLAGLVGVLLRQPLLVSFIAAGILAGPAGVGVVTAVEHIDLLAELGVALLLFLVGLRLDLQLVRTLGAVALATGLGQVAFTSVVGLAICLALGLDLIASTYVAVALTFSSTIIIVKLLSDKREIDALHGRIALGFLIVQDIVVVVAMVALSAIGIGSGGDGGPGALVQVLAGGLLLLGLVALFIRYVADRLLAAMARSPELLVTFAIGWAVLLAAVADAIGFGKELGGLLAGVSLASSSLRDAIAGRLGGVRDFLLVFFFLALGAKLDLSLLGAQLLPAIVLSLFVLLGNPLIVVIIMGFMGYRRRTSFLAGLTVAQISEFSLIFTAMGVALGHISTDMLGLVTLVGLVTITLSTYMILYSQKLYPYFERPLSGLERSVPHRENEADAQVRRDTFDVLLFGVGRYGRGIATGLRRNGLSVVGIDFDPEALRQWSAGGQPGLYGDAADPEFLHSLPLHTARWAVLAVPPVVTSPGQANARVAAVHALRQAGFDGRIVVAASDREDRDELAAAGADIILNPFADAADRAVELITGHAIEARSAPPERLEEQRADV